MAEIYMNSSILLILDEEGDVNNVSAKYYESSSSICFMSAPYIETKYVIVVIWGTGTAVVSALQNSVVLFLFVSNPALRSSSLFYMTFLAICDIIVAVSYFFLMTIQILIEYDENVGLSTLWHSYLRPLFTLSHVSMACSTFLILAATLDRFGTSTKMISITPKRRLFATVVALLTGILTKGTVFFEIRILQHNCTNHNRFQAAFSPLALNYHYKLIWMFWLRNITTVFLPFFILAYCNIVIVQKHRSQCSEMMRAAILGLSVPQNQADETKSSLRSATRMLVLVVTSYLIGNALNVLITAWEHIDQMSLYLNFPMFYTLSADIVSVLTILIGAVRLEIYIYCNSSIRREVCVLLQRAKSFVLLPWRALYFVSSGRRGRKRKKKSAIEEARSQRLMDYSSPTSVDSPRFPLPFHQRLDLDSLEELPFEESRV